MSSTLLVPFNGTYLVNVRSQALLPFDGTYLWQDITNVSSSGGGGGSAATGMSIRFAPAGPNDRAFPVSTTIRLYPKP